MTASIPDSWRGSRCLHKSHCGLRIERTFILQAGRVALSVNDLGSLPKATFPEASQSTAPEAGTAAGDARLLFPASPGGENWITALRKSSRHNVQLGWLPMPAFVCNLVTCKYSDRLESFYSLRVTMVTSSPLRSYFPLTVSWALSAAVAWVRSVLHRSSIWTYGSQLVALFGL